MISFLTGACRHALTTGWHLVKITGRVINTCEHSVAMEWKQTTRSKTVEEGSVPEEGIYVQREVRRCSAGRPLQRRKSHIVLGENTGRGVAHCECSRYTNEAEELEVRPSFLHHFLAASHALDFLWLFTQVRVGRRASACHSRHHLFRPPSNRSEGSHGACHLYRIIVYPPHALISVLFSASPPSISCASCDLQQPQCALQAVQSAPRSLRPPTLSCLLHPRNLGLSFAWSIQQLPNQ